MDTYVELDYCHLKKEYNYWAVGIGLLTVTPMDEAGNPCLVVGIVFYTSAKEHTSHTVASALSIFCTLGIYDELCARVIPYG